MFWFSLPPPHETYDQRYITMRYMEWRYKRRVLSVEIKTKTKQVIHAYVHVHDMAAEVCTVLYM